jgi:hypothetical protein
LEAASEPPRETIGTEAPDVGSVAPAPGSLALEQSVAASTASPDELPEDAAWAATAAAIEKERAALEARRKFMPAGEYVDRLHELLLRRRALSDQRKRITARVREGVVVTLEGPNGKHIRTRITGSIVVRGSRDGWVEPRGSLGEGIYVRSEMGMALQGAMIGETRILDSLSYTVVDIDER